jgi:hypothetical protein
MQEDKVCICDINDIPVIIPADHSILDPASIRHVHQQQVAAFHDFLKSIDKATWKLDISKQDWINSQNKLIDISSDIVSRIQTFPHMPHTYQYIFTKPGLLVKNRKGQPAIIKLGFIEFILANPTKPWDWYRISQNPNITLEIISANSHLPWNWTSISQNPNITPEFILANLTKPWD